MNYPKSLHSPLLEFHQGEMLKQVWLLCFIYSKTLVENTHSLVHVIKRAYAKTPQRLQWFMVRKRTAQATFLKLLRYFGRRSWPEASRLALARIKKQLVFWKPLEVFKLLLPKSVSVLLSLSLSLSLCLCLSLSLTHTHTPSTKARLLPQTPDACINHNCSSASSHVTA